MHRFVWDLHYPPPSPDPVRYGRPLEGPWALPGSYTVRLGTGSATQPLALRMDPRVNVSAADLKQQFELAMTVSQMLAQATEMRNQATSVRQQVQKLRAASSDRAEMSASLDAFDAKLTAVLGKPPRPFGSGTPEENPDRTSLTFLTRELTQIEYSVESADARPTTRELAAASEVRATFASAAAQWNQLKTTALPQLNQQLRSAGMVAIDPSAPAAPERP
jgi:hypothetical protein